MAEFTNAFREQMEEMRALHARGLHNATIIGGAEPKVTPKDLRVLLPDYIDDTGNHGYGKVADLIAYLRHINNIPDVAHEEIWTERDIGPARRSVTFTWWEIETVLPIEKST